MELVNPISILLVDDDDSLRLLAKVILDNLDIDTEIVEASSANQAIEKIEQQEEGQFDLVISDFEMDDGNGGDLYYYIRKNNPQTPFILCSSKNDFQNTTLENFPFNSECEIFLAKPLNNSTLHQSVMTFFQNINHHHTKYAKIRLPFFWRYNKTRCDVFIKLSDQKFVKIIKANSTFSKQDIDKYAKKEIDFLYIKYDDFEKYSSKYSFEFLERDCATQVSVEDEIEVAQAIIHDLVLNVGVSSQVIKLTEEIFSKVKDQFDDRDLITKLIIASHEKNKYFYDHSYLIACFCIAIASQIKWQGQEEDILKKLVTAAIIHDLNTEDTIDTINLDLGIKSLNDLSKNEQEEYIHHPYRMAVLYSKSKYALNDVETIIMQHHEKPDGSGYPRQLTSNNITPLSSIFIIAHYFVNQLYLYDFDTSKIQQMIIDMSKTFNVDNFRIYFHEFVKTFDSFYKVE